MNILFISGDLNNCIFPAVMDNIFIHDIYYAKTPDEVEKVLDNLFIDVVIILFSGELPDPRNLISLLSSKYPDRRVVFSILDSRGNPYNFIQQGQFGPEIKKLFTKAGPQKHLHTVIHR